MFTFTDLVRYTTQQQEENMKRQNRKGIDAIKLWIVS